MVGTALLTIVVPTIPGRAELLSRCLWSIQEQSHPAVHVLVAPGRGLLGDKCNAAAAHVTTPYMCVVDDDDYLQPQFAASVVPLMEAGVDYVGFKVLQLLNGQYYGTASTRGDRSFFDGGSSCHGPCPKGITRTDLWREVPFGNDYMADRRWMKSMYPKVNTHAFVDRVLYVYDHWTSSEGWGHARQIGEWPYDLTSVELLTV